MSFEKIVGTGVLHFARNAGKKAAAAINSSGSEMIHLVRSSNGNLCFSAKLSLAQKAVAGSPNGKKASDIKKVFHFFGRRFRSTKEINDFYMNVLPKLKDEERFIGCLPKNWIKHFNKKDLSKKNAELAEMFSDFANAISLQEKVSAEKLTPYMKQLSEQLGKVFGEKCEISYIGSGGFGRVFRIKCAGEDLALKIFKSNSRVPTILKEISNAASLKHLLKSNQRACFYCGKIPSAQSVNDAFSLMQFIKHDPKVKVNSHRIFDLDPLVYRRFSFNDDHSGNFINNVLIDFGLIDLMYENRTIQNFAKRLFPLIKKGDIEGISRLKKSFQGNVDFEKTIKRIHGLLKLPVDYTYSQKQIKAIDSLI